MRTAKAFVVSGPKLHNAIVPDRADDAIDRINSVVPWVTKAARKFHARLNPHEQSMVGLDDLIQAAWTELLEKDHYFDPHRAKYLTFAIMLIRRLFGAMMDELIREPHHQSLDGDPPGDQDDPVVETAQREEVARKAAQAVRKAMQELTDRERWVVCSYYGIDQAPKTVAMQAAWLVASTSQVICTRLTAERRIRDRIVAG